MSKELRDNPIGVLEHRHKQVLGVKLGMFVAPKNILCIGHEVLCAIGVVFKHSVFSLCIPIVRCRMLLVLPNANQQVLALSFKALKAFLQTEDNLYPC